MIKLSNLTDQQLQDPYFRHKLIECTNFETNDLKSAVLFLFMLKKQNFFTQQEINDFFKSSITIINNSDLLVKLLYNNRVDLEKKLDISEKLIALKIPSFNFAAAKFYESRKFYKQLGNREPKAKVAIIKHQVLLHCEVVAKSQHKTLNQRCLKELKFSNKKIHKRALDMALEKQ